ncbi:hypothetical protein [Nitrospira sp. Kam-Ns4a]
MIRPSDLARPIPLLREGSEELRTFLATPYEHATQMRGEGQKIYPTSTPFDGDRT